MELIEKQQQQINTLVKKIALLEAKIGKKMSNKDAAMIPPIMLGMDGVPLVTEKDFMLEKLRCESKIAM